MASQPDTAVTDRLSIRYPVVQGPFGGGLSTVALVAAVSNRGGLGSFGAHQVEPDDIASLVRELRGATSQPFAVNLWVSDLDPGGLAPTPEDFERYGSAFAPLFEEFGLPQPEPPASYGPRFDVQVQALLEAAPPVFSFVFGVPSKVVLGACRARGIVTIGAATSVLEAEALEAAGVDLIVASGSEAGGHRPSFLARAEGVLCGSFVLTQLLSRAVRTPIITAGGIADRRGVLAAHALGARGVQVGTAFLACEESGAPALHRESLLGAQSRETVLTRAFSGRLARGLRNRWTDLHAEGRRPIAPYPVQGWFLAQLRAAALAAGRTDVISLWSGQIAPVLTQRAAAAVFDSLIGAES